MNRLRLEVLMQAVDKVTGPLKRIMGGSAATSRQVRQLQENLKGLKTQKLAVDNFAKARAEMHGMGANIAYAKTQLKQLEAAGRGSTAEATKLQRAIARQNQLFDAQRQKVLSIRSTLNTLGVGRAGGAGMAAEIERTNAALDKQRAKLQAIHAAQTKAGQFAAKGAATAAAGYGMYYAGARGARAVNGTMGEAKHTATEELRIRALGLESSQANEAIAFAKEFKQYGTSQLDNLQLMRDAITVFNDTHHSKDALPFLARMKYANEVAFGAEEGGENDRKFMDMMKVIEMRGGANTREDFERNANLVQQVLTATGGRVGGSEWLNLIKTGGVAAKGITEKEFFYRLEPLVQEMGGDRVGTGMMSAYQNIYQGRTTKRAANQLQSLGLIADPSKVKHDKVGQIAQLGVGALKGSDIFQRSQFEWMEKVLIPAFEAKGIKSEKEVLDAMGGIFSNRNAAAVFSTMFQQRSMINKSYALNEQADNVDTLYGRAKDTPTGKEVELLKRRNDLYQRMGNALMPAYIKLLEVVTKATEGITNFAKAHPVLTKWVLYGAAGLALFTAALGALLIPIGLILAKGALLRFVLTRIGLGFVSWGGAARLAGSALSWLWGLLGKGAGFLATAGRWLWSLGGTLLRLVPVVLRFLGPWGMIAATVASVAAYIWTNWDSLGPKFAAWWQTFKTGFMEGLNFVLGLPQRFFAAGAAVMDGMVNGITSRLAAVREAIGGAADNAIGWFKEKLGIHSPSRVFAELGGYVSEGAAQGIAGGTGMVRNAALSMAAATLVPMGTMAAPAQPVAMGGGGGNTYSISITVEGNANGDEIARAVRAEIERIERQRGARRNSTFADID